MDLRVARQKALARAMLDHLDRSVTPADIPMDQLEEFYQSNRARFVHGVLRQVVHVVARTGDKRFGATEAHAIAKEFHDAASGISSREKFVEAGAVFEKKYGSSFKVEVLPPFPATGSSFVPEFTREAFAISAPRQMSEPFETSFGWHVVLLLDELPASNKTFDDALPLMRRALLPRVKKHRTDEALEKLADESGVKLLEWPEGEGGAR